MTPMKIACPAKINLTLEVLDRRDDGYHALRSVMVPLALADELTIERAERFSFRCDDAALESDDNLAVRAARAVSPDARVAISLAKRIPSQAGLGGGSSDAAGVLHGAMRGAFGAIPHTDWLSVARTLGSDVPFFLVESGALVEGTGERVTSVGALPPWHVLVVKPLAAVSTAQAYAELDRTTRPSRPRSASVSLDMVAALQRHEFSTVQAMLSNDFHDLTVARVPEVAAAIDALKQAGALQPLLAGSGSAVFALAQTADEVAEIDKRLLLPAAYKRFRTMFDQSGTWRE